MSSWHGVTRCICRKHPNDVRFLKPQDLVDLRNSAFDGMPEWDAFAEHYATCELCNA